MQIFTPPGQGEYYADRPQASWRIPPLDGAGWVIRSRTTGEIAPRTSRYPEADFTRCQNDADALNEAFATGVLQGNRTRVR